MSFAGNEVASFDYALLGWKASERLGNGLERQLEYDDGMNVIRDILKQDGSRKALRDYEYKYDAMGRMASAVDLRDNHWTVYNYNDLNQLTQVAEVEKNLSRKCKLPRQADSS